MLLTYQNLFLTFISTLTIGCLRDDNCKRLKSGVSEADRMMIIDLHNRIRSNIARGISSGISEEDGATLDDIFLDYQPKASRMKEMVSAALTTVERLQLTIPSTVSSFPALV
jgi:hypothetical protein